MVHLAAPQSGQFDIQRAKDTLMSFCTPSTFTMHACPRSDVKIQPCLSVDPNDLDVDGWVVKQQKYSNALLRWF
jgi:hypothetical protein